MTSFRQLGAIMFTDIVGYTAMMQHDEQQAVNSAKHHEKVLEECVKKHAGKVYQYYGDGSLSIFTSTSEAVRCAIEMQQFFQQDPKLPLRIGIHLGEVRFEDGKVFGDGVNIASRLEGLGLAGSVIISEKVKNEIKNQPDISNRFMGIFQLKNVEKPVAVFAVQADGLVIPELKLMQGKARLISTKQKSDEEHPAKRFLIRMLAILGAIALILTGISSYFDFWQKKKSTTRSYSLTPLSTSSWFEGFESWSPDGNMFTYVSLISGNPDIYIKNRKEGDAIRIVNTPYDEYNPRWSPDGSKIAYISIRDDGTNIYWVPSTGGVERKLVETQIPGRVQVEWPFYGFGIAPWSPDGKELLFSKMYENGTLAITKVDLQSGEETQMTNPPLGSIDFSASWSPNGNLLVFTRNGQLWIKNLSGEHKEQPLLPNQMVLIPSFSNDSQKVVFTLMGETGMNIWEMKLATQELQQLTFSTRWMFSSTTSPGGGLSVDQFSHQIDLIKLNPENGEEERLTYHNNNNFYGRFSPDIRKLVYQSDRTGNCEIWLIDLETKNDMGYKEVNLTDNPSFDFRADWSPVEEQIAFFSDRDSVFKVWIMDSEGKNLRKASDEIVRFALDPMTEYAHQLKWSPDGKKIAYMALSEGGNSLWIADPEKQTAQPVISNINSFTWYQSGNTIICDRKSADRKNATNLVAFNLETKEEKILLPDLPAAELFSSRAGDWLGYTSAIGHFSFNLFRLPLSPPSNPEGFPTVAGEPERLTDGSGKWHVHNGTFSPDGKYVLYSRDTDQLDIFLIEDYQ